MGGNLGAHLANGLASTHEVWHFSEQPPRVERHPDVKTEPGVRYLDSIPWLMSRTDADVIIHAAGPAGETRCRKYAKAAIEQHVSLTECLARSATARLSKARIVYLSSYYAGGEGFYGALKAAGESLLENLSNTLVLRLPHVYGPRLTLDGDHILDRLVTAAIKKQPMRVNVEGRLSLLHVDDVVDLLRYVITRPIVGGTYNVHAWNLHTLALALAIENIFKNRYHETLPTKETFHGGTTRLAPGRLLDWRPRSDVIELLIGMIDELRTRV